MIAYVVSVNKYFYRNNKQICVTEPGYIKRKQLATTKGYIVGPFRDELGWGWGHVYYVFFLNCFILFQLEENSCMFG